MLNLIFVELMREFVPTDLRADLQRAKSENSIVNREYESLKAEVMKSVQGEWDSASCSWSTAVYVPKKPSTIPDPAPSKLPQTGF